MAQEKEKTNMNPLVSGIAGAAVGAAATAAVMAMSDKRTRDKMKDTFNSLKSQGQKKINDLTNQAKHVADKTQDEMKQRLSKTEPLKAV